ncbi:hypothetical protein [Microbacterium sp. NPDC055683]
MSETTAVPSVDPEGIRSYDLDAATWTWDTQGEWVEVTLQGGVGTAVDPYFQQEARFTAGDPVYADANGDGLLDAAAPLTWEAGNGIYTAHFVWLAQPEQGAPPQQVPYPLTFGGRCADSAAEVTAVSEGFEIRQVRRGTGEESPCAEVGTLDTVRTVTIVGDGTADGSWPMTTDGLGWGGHCPVRTDGGATVMAATGRVAPSAAAPATTASGERAYYALTHYPLRQPDGWVLAGFAPEPDVDDTLVCVWVPTGA